MTIWTKDPQAVLDFARDWTAFLAGDTIASSSWAVEGGGAALVIDSDSNTDSIATVWLSGGAHGKDYLLTNTIVTAAGRTDEWSAIVRVLSSAAALQTSLLSTSQAIVTERPRRMHIHVWHGETWYDALPQMVDPETGDPYDLTGVTLEEFIRPSLNHATRLVQLTSAGSAGILKENAAEGLAAYFYSQASVEANLPLSPTLGWERFMRLSFTDPDLGAVKKILTIGRMFVHPAKDSPTP